MRIARSADCDCPGRMIIVVMAIPECSIVVGICVYWIELQIIAVARIESCVQCAAYGFDFTGSDDLIFVMDDAVVPGVCKDNLAV